MCAPPRKLVEMEYTSAKREAFQKQKIAIFIFQVVFQLNNELSMCNNKYLNRVSGSTFSKGTYVLGPQERL